MIICSIKANIQFFEVSDRKLVVNSMIEVEEKGDRYI